MDHQSYVTFDHDAILGGSLRIEDTWYIAKDNVHRKTEEQLFLHTNVPQKDSISQFIYFDLGWRHTGK